MSSFVRVSLGTPDRSERQVVDRKLSFLVINAICYTLVQLYHFPRIPTVVFLVGTNKSAVKLRDTIFPVTRRVQRR